MKQKIIATLILILLVSIVTAGFESLLVSWNNSINLKTSRETQIKISGNVDEIDIKISPIECNAVNCYAWVNQEGVINSKWVGRRTYCSNWNNELDKCIKESNYTVEELQQRIKKYIEKKLNRWADAEINRSLMAEKVKVTARGTISS